ncbi:PREDICTED: protein ERGIC-53-like [Acropora digitifera]|uniref:protein ERGIC-53-like n=1 Tax=Acropora digitifera TaxID=70779 RepID=UPI00077B039F|nr:PREDICTED: protein ERGIC-53-like [Acropora digitifera]XP_029212118.2 protein ERGIC-53-like [Acropora millepora]
MASSNRCCSVTILLLLIPIGLATEASERHVKFQYKHSFKGPHLANKEGSIPFWAHGGSAIPSDDQIRLTPSMTNKKGYLWTKSGFPHDWWEVEVAIKVTGVGRLGGDGVAIWYTETAGIEGPAFGNVNTWKGLGIFCDSFDNDQQGNNPFISVMLNDGTHIYDHNKDGQDLQRGGCLRDFRNRPNPVKLKIRYYENVLTLWVHMGMSMKAEDFELCTRLENIALGKGGYFGLSAATGGLADDHDVISFITHSLTPPKKDGGSEQGMSEEEQRKLAEQYEEYQKKLEQQREEFKTAHPEKTKQPEAQYENAYERDVRLVYEGQNAIHQMIGNLHNKVGELTLQINTLYTLVTGDHNKLNNVVTVDQTISRQEVNTLINVQQQLVAKLQEMSNMMNQGGNVVKRDTGESAVTNTQLSNMQKSIESLTESVNHFSTKQQITSRDKRECPPPPPMPQCIGPGYFVVLIVMQIIMLLGYIAYMNQKEAAAKKFF